MDSGRIGRGTRELARRASGEDSAPKPASGATPPEEGNVNAPYFAASKPVTAERQERLPLAPFQRVTPHEKQNIAEFLTFAEAASLMLSSRDMHLAIQGDRWLRLDEISKSFQRLGVHDYLKSMQSLEAEISQLQQQSAAGAVVADEPAETAKRGISLARLVFWRRAAKEAPEQAQMREKEAQEVQVAARLELLELSIEDLVIHFAAERQKGPRPLGAAPNVYAHPENRLRSLRAEISKGDVALMRASLRELLSLPERLMPNARKLALLREPLRYFGKYKCGNFEQPERERCEAIIAYVDEIVSSAQLSKSEKSEFFNMREPLTREGRVVERDIFGYALFHGNPAVAAAILLGIHASRTVPDQPDLKKPLLAGIGESWGGLGNCVDCVVDLLRPYQFRAPNFVDALTERLKSMPTAPTLPAETKEPFRTPGY